jgi:hypothetical protein
MRSPYAGSHAERIDEALPAKDCRGCHMPSEEVHLGDRGAKNGRIASHRFVGAHTWLAAMRHDGDALSRTQAFLASAASVDVAAVVHQGGARSLPADGAPIVPGERVRFEITVRNLGAGHRFPGGTLDAQDVWLEVTLRDARGRLVAEAGAEHDRSGDDGTAHRLRALLLDRDGRPVLERQVNHFRAVAFDHTLAPRDATVVAYDVEIPTDLDAQAMPLRVDARLRHRTRSLPVQRAACDAFRNARGRAFAAAAGSGALDVCAAQPVVDIASAEAWIGPGADTHAVPSRLPLWRRLYEHGLGLSHAVQERLDEARPSLERALKELEANGGSARERAMILQALAHVAARQGRLEEAIGFIDGAEDLLPGHVALARERGYALAQVWRWKDAAIPLAVAASSSPLDEGLWVELAIASGSSGDDRGALDSARHGLPLRPFDPDLLRIQALALTALGSARAGDATRAYLEHRVADEAPAFRAACTARVPGCRLEREPIHAHPMRVRAAP